MVATSVTHQELATRMGLIHKAIAVRMKDAHSRAAIEAIGAARQMIAASYGSSQVCVCTPNDKEIIPDNHSPPSWAHSHAHAPLCDFVGHVARVASLCCSFATKHRSEPNVENDVDRAIMDAVKLLHAAFVRVENEVFVHSPTRTRKSSRTSDSADSAEPAESAARVIHLRSHQLAQRARYDVHGEVFAGVEYTATFNSLVEAAGVFNKYYIGITTFAFKSWYCIDEFSRYDIAAESHARLSDALRLFSLGETTITNTLLRAAREAKRVQLMLSDDNPEDVLGDVRNNTTHGQPLYLEEWVSEAMRTGLVRFELVGGMSMDIQGSFTFLDSNLQDADWWCLRARTTDPLTGDVKDVMDAALAAWRRIRYDTMDETTEDHLRLARNVGVALHGRDGCEGRENIKKYADLIVIDAGIAPKTLSLTITPPYSIGADVMSHNARPIMRWMFSHAEIERARQFTTIKPFYAQRTVNVDDAVFLSISGDSKEDENGNGIEDGNKQRRKGWLPYALSTASPTVVSSKRVVEDDTLPDTLDNVDSLPPIPEISLSPSEAFHLTMVRSALSPLSSTDLNIKLTEPIERTGSAYRERICEVSLALTESVCKTILESVHGMDDLLASVTDAAKSYGCHERGERSAITPKSICKHLVFKPERCVDVASALLGLPLPPRTYGV